MEPVKMAVVGVTLVVVVVGMLIGVSFLTFPAGDDGGHNQLTRTTTDTDLLELGLEVPDTWEFGMSDGSTIALSDLEGQVILVDLMATWCTTCKIQNGYLETIHEDLAGSVMVISLSVDYSSETTADMAQYMIDEDVAWAHGVDDTLFLNYFSVTSLPSLVLIDSDGYFRYFHVGLWSEASISSTITSIL